MSSKQESKFINGIKDIAAGSFGGICQCIAGHPFDTVKVRLQTTNEYKGMIDCFQKMVKTEGITSVYKGVQSPILGFAAFNAILFVTFGFCKSIFQDPEKGEITERKYFFISGMISGVTLSVAEGPGDLFKCQLQNRYKDYNGFFDCAKKIATRYGVRGVFQGFGATVLRNAPANGMYLGCYESMKRYQLKEGQTVEDLTTAQLLLSGGIGGGAYWLTTYPLDVVKSTMQSDSIVKSERKYSTIANTFKLIYKESGIKGFFKGFTPCMVRSFPANALCFAGYEKAKEFLNKI